MQKYEKSWQYALDKRKKRGIIPLQRPQTPQRSCFLNLKCKKGEFEMLRKLREYGLEVLLLGLIDKLLSALVKKLSAWQDGLRSLIARKTGKQT